MNEEVTVHVNRGAADSLEPSVEAVQTREPFTLTLESHGAPAHVHCRLGGDLARIAALETSNYYVAADDETYVPIDVAAEAIDEPVSGDVEVVTGYGSESVSIPVTVEPAPASVDIDESLAEPGGGNTTGTNSGAASGANAAALERIVGRFEPATLAVVGLGIAAVGIGALTAMTIGGPVATAGVVIVLAGVAIALGLLLR